MSDKKKKNGAVEEKRRVDAGTAHDMALVAARSVQELAEEARLASLRKALDEVGQAVREHQPAFMAAGHLIAAAWAEGDVNYERLEMRVAIGDLVRGVKLRARYYAAQAALQPDEVSPSLPPNPSNTLSEKEIDRLFEMGIG